MNLLSRALLLVIGNLFFPIWIGASIFGLIFFLSGYDDSSVSSSVELIIAGVGIVYLHAVYATFIFFIPALLYSLVISALSLMDPINNTWFICVLSAVVMALLFPWWLHHTDVGYKIFDHMVSAISSPVACMVALILLKISKKKGRRRRYTRFTSQTISEEKRCTY